ATFQRDVSTSLNNIGYVRFVAGDRAGALSAYEESLVIRRRLAAADPGNAGWQRDVSTSLNLGADLRRAAGDRAGALAAYEEGLAIRRKLASSDPDNTEWQRDLSVSLNNVGNVLLSAGDRTGALAVYEEGLVIVRRLAAADPGNVTWQRDVNVSLDKIGDVRLAGDGANPGRVCHHVRRHAKPHLSPTDNARPRPEPGARRARAAVGGRPTRRACRLRGGAGDRAQAGRVRPRQHQLGA